MEFELKQLIMMYSLLLSFALTNVQGAGAGEPVVLDVEANSRGAVEEHADVLTRNFKVAAFYNVEHPVFEFLRSWTLFGLLSGVEGGTFSGTAVLTITRGMKTEELIEKIFKSNDQSPVKGLKVSFGGVEQGEVINFDAFRSKPDEKILIYATDEDLQDLQEL